MATEAETVGRRKAMMKWEAEEKGYSCNDCYLAMQNCHDKSICCEDETGLCDWFEELPQEGGRYDESGVYDSYSRLGRVRALRNVEKVGGAIGQCQKVAMSTDATQEIGFRS